MKVSDTTIPGVLIVEPKIFGDARGFFLEAFSSKRYADAGITATFVQDNLSFSSKGVLRGLHFQNPQCQGKLVCVPFGSVYDVVVDIRRGSPTFGKWLGIELSADNGKQLWIPPGLAHGFQVLSDQALFSYKCTDYYAPQHEHSLAWNDPKIGIDWPMITNAQISAKDRAAKSLSDFDPSELPVFNA